MKHARARKEAERAAKLEAEKRRAMPPPPPRRSDVRPWTEAETTALGEALNPTVASMPCPACGGAVSVAQASAGMIYFQCDHCTNEGSYVCW